MEETKETKTKENDSKKRKKKERERPNDSPFVPTPHMRACFGSWRTVSSYSLSSYAMRADCGYLWCSRMYASVDYREGFTVLRKMRVCVLCSRAKGRVDVE